MVIGSLGRDPTDSWLVQRLSNFVAESLPETASTWTSSGDFVIFRCAALWLTAIWSDWSFRRLFHIPPGKTRLQQQTHNNWFVVCVLLGFFAHSILLLLLLLQNVINFVFPSSSLLPRCRPLCLTDFLCSRHSAASVFQLLALERSKKKRKKVKLSAGVFCREERGRTRRSAFDSLLFWKYLRKRGHSVLNAKAARPALISAERNEEGDKKLFNQKSLCESLKLGRELIEKGLSSMFSGSSTARHGVRQLAS